MAEKENTILIGVLKVLAETVADQEEKSEEEYYQSRVDRIRNMVKEKVSGNFSFEDLLEVCADKKKSYDTVLPNLQNSAGFCLKKCEDSDEVKTLLTEIEARAKSLAKVLLSSSSSDWGDSAVERLNDAFSIVTKANKLLKQTKREVSKAQKEYEGVLSTVLTVLGLFVAVIAAVVGVYLNGVVEKLNHSLPLSEQIFLSALRWHITFLLIFFLIFLIGKLTGRSLAARCKEHTEDDKGEDCAFCTKKDGKKEKEKECKKRRQIRKRFPWLILMNGAFLIVELAALFVIINIWNGIITFLKLYWWRLLLVLAIIVAFWYFFKKESPKETV